MDKGYSQIAFDELSKAIISSYHHLYGPVFSPDIISKDSFDILNMRLVDAKTLSETFHSMFSLLGLRATHVSDEIDPPSTWSVIRRSRDNQYIDIILSKSSPTYYRLVLKHDDHDGSSLHLSSEVKIEVFLVNFLSGDGIRFYNGLFFDLKDKSAPFYDRQYDKNLFRTDSTSRSLHLLCKDQYPKLKYLGDSICFSLYRILTELDDMGLDAYYSAGLDNIVSFYYLYPTRVKLPDNTEFKVYSGICIQIS